MRTAHVFKYHGTGHHYPAGTVGELVGRGWAGEIPNLQATSLRRPAGFSRAGVGPLGGTGGTVVQGDYGGYPIVWDRGAVYAGRVGETVPRALKAMRGRLAAAQRSGAVVVTAAGRLQGWKGLREPEEVILEDAPIPSGYEAVVGVEIEYYPRMGGTEVVTRAIFRAGLAGAVSVAPDGSLSQGGVELRVMATREHLERVVRKALAIAPGRVDSSCGLHVHLDMRHRDVDRVWANLLAMEGVICRSQPRERIEPDGRGGYCKMLKGEERSLDGCTQTARDRYRAINAASLAKGTIEVRAHTGSSNPTKILAWCEFLNAIAELGVEIIPGATAEETLVAFEGIVGREFPYVRERMLKFAQGWAEMPHRVPGGGEASEVAEVCEDPEEDLEEPAGYAGCDCTTCRRHRGRGAE